MEKPPLSERWATLQQVMVQDIEPDPEGGGPRIKRGVAKERRISVKDGEMRHGRKSKSSRVDGYKRHLALDVQTRIIVAAAVTPANRPEAEATADLLSDLERQRFRLRELHIDRGYLAAKEVEQQRARGVPIHCKAFPLHNGGRFTKADFRLDFEQQSIQCPAGQRLPLVLGQTAHFPASVCTACPLRAQCTTATGTGRSVHLHPQEPFFAELRRKQRTAEGRAQLRLRTPVEHGLASISRSQGRRARYRGVRNNLFDLRRHCAVHNLHVAASAA